MMELLAGAALSFLTPWASVLATLAALTVQSNLLDGVCLATGLFTLLFAMDYIKHRKREFVALMTVFLASMLLFLNAQDWLYLYFSWELMGLCSYLLIALRETEPARKAARRALVINRISGVAFLLAIVLISLETGSFSFGVVPPTAALLLFIAAMIKSSQIPFVWLPDAMEAPTPVSALLHSATMVAAGPLLLHRFQEHFLFLSGFIRGWAMLSIVVASFLALVQHNQKRVLAYSTIATVAFLYTVFSSPLLPVAFSVHAFLKAAYFILVGTYAAGQGYELETGLNRKSLSSALSLFLMLSLSGAPLLGMFWFKIGENTAALTVFLSVLYFTRMYCASFSGGAPPRKGIGTSLALVMAGLSVLLYPVSVPPLSSTVSILAATAAGLILFNFKPLAATGNALNWLFSRKFPEMEPPEERLENWGYLVGRAARHGSQRLNRTFTGPVGRDVGYIAASLAALAMGVMLC